jgi:hypothetical protein
VVLVRNLAASVGLNSLSYRITGIGKWRTVEKRLGTKNEAVDGTAVKPYF